MSKNKSKIRKLTDAQYNEYIANLKDDPALYNADGSKFVPPEIDVHDDPEEKNQAD